MSTLFETALGKRRSYDTRRHLLIHLTRFAQKVLSQDHSRFSAFARTKQMLSWALIRPSQINWMKRKRSGESMGDTGLCLSWTRLSRSWYGYIDCTREFPYFLWCLLHLQKDIACLLPYIVYAIEILQSVKFRHPGRRCLCITMWFLVSMRQILVSYPTVWQNILWSIISFFQQAQEWSYG